MKEKYRSFEEARKFAQALKLKSGDEWREYCKSGNKPSDVPAYPEGTYKNKGWKGYGNFLGTGNIAPKDREFRSFEDAKKFAQTLKLKSGDEWREYCKSANKPSDVPANPEGTYKNKGWKGYGNFLGTGNIAPKDREYRSFEDAKKFAQSLGLKGQLEWKEYCKSGNKPSDIPANPNRTYKNKGWKGYGNFLGTGRISNQEKAKNWLPIKEAKIEARRIAKELGIKTNADYYDAYDAGKIPRSLPRYLYDIYGTKSKNMKKDK